MGYAHGTQWDDDKIKSEIYAVMKIMHIDRMPSNSEIKEVTRSHSLSMAIQHRGGFYAWADKLGLEIKKSETTFGIDAENFIIDKLVEFGFDAEKTPIKHPYDIIVNRAVKVDVKIGRIVYTKGCPYYTFNLEKQYQTCDFYIAVTVKEDDSIKDIYVIPSFIMAGKTQLSIGINKTIYSKYRDRWDLIEIMDAGFMAVEKAIDGKIND